MTSPPPLGRRGSVGPIRVMGIQSPGLLASTKFAVARSVVGLVEEVPAIVAAEHRHAREQLVLGSQLVGPVLVAGAPGSGPACRPCPAIRTSVARRRARRTAPTESGLRSPSAFRSVHTGASRCGCRSGCTARCSQRLPGHEAARKGLDGGLAVAEHVPRHARSRRPIVSVRGVVILGSSNP